jgi:excinuclease UvrABC nuclease subunit
MARKTVKFTPTGIEKLPDNMPVVYRIQTEGGKTNYVGVAKRGRVQERLQEHLDAAQIPGAKVQVQQMPSIQEAEKTEARVIAHTEPKYNERGK